MEQKPIILAMDEAKRELVQCVNDILAKHNLSCYLIEPMFAELYGQIQATAKREIEVTRANYEKTEIEKGAE